MDQWDEAWLGRTNPPTLRAVSGRGLRVLPRRDVPVTGTVPPALEDAEPDGVRVLVVGDDMLARHGMRVALENRPGLAVVGERRPGREVAAAVRAHHPDVLLLHGLSASEAEPTVTAARTASDTIRVLAVGARGGLSTQDDEERVCGRLPASASPEEVVAAVRMVAAGYRLRRDARPPVSDQNPGVALAGGLTERERDVLTLLARGMSNTEIAGVLTVSEHTVKSHVQNLLGKLKLRNRIHAVIYAFQTGLARP